MLQRILDNIEGILIELKDNDIDFELDIKDKRLNMFRMDIKFVRLFKTHIKNKIFDENGKMFNYISEALLTLDTYLKKLGMNVKVHCKKDYEGGFNITMEEFTEMDPKNLNLVIIGIDKDHRKPKLEKINSYSQFINEAFDKNSIKDFCERSSDLIKDFAITNRPFNNIVISLRSNQNKFRAKRFLTEELRDINSNISGGRFKEIDKIYNDEDAHVKSRASGILLKDKLRKEEMDSILTALENGARPEDFNTEDHKLLRILVLMNNLKFLKDTLQDKGKLQCEYCGKGPLIIYDVVASKFKNLIDNPHYKLNQNFDPEWGATCDHKDPQSLGGDKFDYSNLAVCCYRCNQRKRSMPYKQWMERIGKTNESLVVPRQPIDQMADTFIIEVFDKFDIDYCRPEDEEKMQFAQETYWTFVFEDRDGKGGLLEKPYPQFLEICWLDSELYTNVMNELIAIKSMVERRTGYSYKLKHSNSWDYEFITIDTRDIYGNFLRPE